MTKFIKWVGLLLLGLMANDCIPYKKPGEDFTGQAFAAITGKRFLDVAGNRTSGPLLASTSEGSNYQVAHCAAGKRPVGVSMYDAPINGKVGIINGGIVPVTAGGTITFGQEVQSDATGQAVAYDNTLASRPCGKAMSGATVGQDCEILLDIG